MCQFESGIGYNRISEKTKILINMKKLALFVFSIIVGLLLFIGAYILAWGISPMQKSIGLVMYLCGTVICAISCVKIKIQ